MALGEKTKNHFLFWQLFFFCYYIFVYFSRKLSFFQPTPKWRLENNVFFSFNFHSNSTTNTNNVGIYSTNNLLTSSNNNNNSSTISDNLGVNSTNNSNNIGNNWRSTTSSTIMSSTSGSGVESTSSIQKRGAERLFQYMEADGSDPEDYTR